MGASFGKNFIITIFGESHAASLGIVIDGMIPGFTIDFVQIDEELKRRAPRGKISTARCEEDKVRVLSGYTTCTTGSPLCLVIDNNNTKSSDYEAIKDTPRPSHADYVASVKYNNSADYRGGGHFSGRITAAITVAGAIAKQILKKYDIKIKSRIKQINTIVDQELVDVVNFQTTEFGMINTKASEAAIKIIEEAYKDGDSVGGVIECFATGCPVGLGNPFFDSLESRISQIVFSIPSVKGIEFGSGFELAKMYGSMANDAFYFDNDVVKTKTNHNGGINGGISNGMPISFAVVIKPTPSIAKPQETVNLKTKENTTIAITGRHDPCIVHRARVVVEDALAIVLVDSLFSNYTWSK